MQLIWIHKVLIAAAIAGGVVFAARELYLIVNVPRQGSVPLLAITLLVTGALSYYLLAFVRKWKRE